MATVFVGSGLAGTAAGPTGTDSAAQTSQHAPEVPA